MAATFFTKPLPQPPSMAERFDSQFDNASPYYPLSSGCSTRRRSMKAKAPASYYSFPSDSDDDSCDMRRARHINLTTSGRKSVSANSFYLSSASSMHDSPSTVNADIATIERELTLKRLRKQYYGSDYSDESADDTNDEEYAQWADNFLLEVEDLKHHVYSMGLCSHGVDEELEKCAIRSLYNQNHSDSPVMSREGSAHTDTDAETATSSVPSDGDRDLQLQRLRRDFYGSEYSDGDESAEDKDDEEYAEWIDDFLLEVNDLRRQVYAAGLCAAGVDEETEKLTIRALYNRNHPTSPIMSRACSVDSSSSN